jgi:hypothetical protein
MGWEGRNKMKSSNDSKKAQLRHLLEPTLFLAGFLKEHGSQPGLLFSEGIYRLQAFFFFSPPQFHITESNELPEVSRDHTTVQKR